MSRKSESHKKSHISSKRPQKKYPPLRKHFESRSTMSTLTLRPHQNKRYTNILTNTSPNQNNNEPNDEEIKKSIFKNICYK